MDASNKSQFFERHVNAFLNEWKAVSVLERYVLHRMARLGVRPVHVGILDDVETGTAFSLEHAMGGRNTRPAWSGPKKGGINVDYAVFDPEHLSLPSWASASLRDRIDAVIIHELCEFRSRARTTKDRHRNAILRAPYTRAEVTPGARKVLEDYRDRVVQRR